MIKLWSHALISQFDVFSTTDIKQLEGVDAVVVEAIAIDQHPKISALFTLSSTRFLIAGKDWSEAKQINALVNGAAGYCGESEPPKLLLQAVIAVLKGDIWIQRHLVPRVIGTLVKMKPQEKTAENNTNSIEASAKLQSLSSRESDVAKMIQAGENNKNIADALNISERTVKAHLSSIFKKLDVPDRLHLALFIKEYS